jgi:uncharacterized protein YbcI
MPYKIYTLSDNTGNDIFYVGCTRNSVSERLMQHLKDAYSRNPKSAKIIALNYEVLITVVEVLESNDKMVIKAAEERWILHYQKKGYTLTNTYVPKKNIEEIVGYTFSSKKLMCYNKLRNKFKKAV